MLTVGPLRKCGGAPPAAPAGFSAFARRGRARLLQLAAAARVRAEGLSRDTDTYEPNSFKGTLHYPKPTPSENQRRKLKNSKTQNPHILGVSMKGALSGKKEEKKSADSGSPNPCRDGAEVVSETGGFL